MKTTDEMKFGEQQHDRETMLSMKHAHDPKRQAAAELLEFDLKGRPQAECDSILDQWLEIHSINARLQITQALAILGWAAFILSMMGV